MRISKFIDYLRFVQAHHGDVHLVVKDADHNTGSPMLRCTTVMKSGNKRTTQRWEIVTKEQCR